MRGKKTIILISALALIIIAVLVGYFIFRKKESNSKDWYNQKLDEGYLPISLSTQNVSNNLEDLNLKQGNLVDIYFFGNGISEEVSKEPFIKNAIIANDFDSASNGLVLFAPENMHSSIKCSTQLALRGYRIEIKGANSDENQNNKMEMNQEIRQFLDESCIDVPVE